MMIDVCRRNAHLENGLTSMLDHPKNHKSHQKSFDKMLSGLEMDMRFRERFLDSSRSLDAIWCDTVFRNSHFFKAVTLWFTLPLSPTGYPLSAQAILTSHTDTRMSSQPHRKPNPSRVSVKTYLNISKWHPLCKSNYHLTYMVIHCCTCINDHCSMYTCTYYDNKIIKMIIIINHHHHHHHHRF